MSSERYPRSGVQKPGSRGPAGRACLLTQEEFWGLPELPPICRNKDLGSHHHPDPGSVSWARVTIRGKQPSAGPAPCIVSTKAGLDALGQGPAFPGFWPEHIFKEGGEFLAQMRLKGFWGGRVRTAFQITVLPEILSPRLNYTLQSTVN